MVLFHSGHAQLFVSMVAVKFYKTLYPSTSENVKIME